MHPDCVSIETAHDAGGTCINACTNKLRVLADRYMCEFLRQQVADGHSWRGKGARRQSQQR